MLETLVNWREEKFGYDPEKETTPKECVKAFIYGAIDGWIIIAALVGTIVTIMGYMGYEMKKKSKD